MECRMDRSSKGTQATKSSDTNPWHLEEAKNQEWDRKLPEVVASGHLNICNGAVCSVSIPFLNEGYLESFASLKLSVYCDRWERLSQGLKDAYATHEGVVLEDTIDEQLKLEVFLFSERDPYLRKKLARGLIGQVWHGKAPKSAPWYSKTMQFIRDVDACCFMKRLIDARCMVNCDPLLLPFNEIEPAVQGFLTEDYKDENAWSPYIEEDFIYRLFAEGFITIAVNIKISRGGRIILIPKMHAERSYLLPLDIIMMRRGKQMAKELTITIDRSFHKVIAGIVEQHGENWMYSEMQEAFNRMHYQRNRCNSGSTRMHSVEVWKGDELVAGEIGVVNGAVYTSVTGFHTIASSGTFQMYALAAILHFQGFEMWDLGMEIPYKRRLGAQTVTRDGFIRDFRAAKTKARVLEVPSGFINCKSSIELIDAFSQEQKNKLGGSKGLFNDRASRSDVVPLPKSKDVYNFIHVDEYDMSGSIFTRLSQRCSNLAAELLDFYNYATLKQQHIIMMCSGAVLGAVVGAQLRKKRIAAGEFSDNIEVMAYKTDSVDEFEASWNRLARFAQKRPDYKHTKLYKAVHWDKEFPHYLQLRLWKYEDSIDKFHQLAQSTGLMKRMDDSTKVAQQVRPVTIIDDSIRRGIPF